MRQILPHPCGPVRLIEAHAHKSRFARTWGWVWRMALVLAAARKAEHGAFEQIRIARAYGEPTLVGLLRPDQIGRSRRP